MAQNSFVITIDIGTGSVRAILFDLQGRQVASSQREWLPESPPQYPGAQDFNTIEAWKLIVTCVREVQNAAHVQSGNIAALTATSMREGMVLYDRAKREIWACTNADARASTEVRELVEKGLAETVYRTGGDWPTIISPARFLWLKRNEPSLFDRIEYMTMLSDWVLFKLSGEIVTDTTCGSSSGLFDLTRRSWSRALIAKLDLPTGIYPPVYEPGTRIGAVTKGASSETGLPEGAPVVAAGGDTQLALLGTGATQPGNLTVVGGTFWQTTAVTDKPLVDPKCRLRTLCHALSGQWMVEGIGFYHGFTMRWFRDGFCHDEVSEAVKREVDPYEVMEERASEIPPGSNNVLAIFSNIMKAREWRHGVPSFIGFNVMDAKGTGKAACIRALEENAAYTSRGHFEILKEISGYDPDVVTFCGGSSKGTLWPQIMADVLNLQVRIPVVKEATSLGSAMCAAVSLGQYADLQEASSSFVQWEREITPVKEHVLAYNDGYALWLRAYPYLLSMANDEVLPPLWRSV
jgi:autoinducer 2 (AI-2) kinase